jgi:hypothetical protein
MRTPKPLLFVLSGVWLALLLIEKATATTGSLRMRNRMAPLRAGYYVGRWIKSLLIVVLAVINLFLAISVIDNRR